MQRTNDLNIQIERRNYNGFIIINNIDQIIYFTNNVS